MFKSIAYSLLYQAAKQIIGAIAWQNILAEVDALMMNPRLTGAQKFEAAKAALLAQGEPIKTSLIHFGIETAYQYLQRRAP